MPFRPFGIIALCFVAAPLTAQHVHLDTQHDTGSQEAPLTEPGQGAFAAIAEVVRKLEADPTTDWSEIDLDALRSHLVDMDRVATHARVRVERLPDGLQAVATGDAPTVAALGRMVPAHAAQLMADPGWTAIGKAIPDGAILIVTSDDPATVLRIHALGFFGLMASQDHHRAHHLAIATGGSPHVP